MPPAELPDGFVSVSFEDMAPNTMVPISNYGGILWDYSPDPRYNTGWTVWNTPNSIPADGLQYAVNTNGENFLGFGFDQPTLVQSLSISKCSRRVEVDVDDSLSYSAEEVRLYFFDCDGNCFAITSWIPLYRFPTNIECELVVSRVEIEHYAEYGFPSGPGQSSDQNWYSIDAVRYEMPDRSKM